MSILFLDSVMSKEHLLRYSTFSGVTIQTGVSESGRDAYQFTAVGGPQMTRSISPTTSLMAGFYGLTTNLTGDSGLSGFQLRVGATARIALHITISGAVRIRAGVGGSIIATSATGVVGVNQWNYYELRAVLGGSGIVQVWVNGAQVINFSGAIGAAADFDDATFSRFSLGNWQVSDIEIRDDTLPTGPHRIWWLLPNGAGTNTNLSRFPDTGEANWQDVDEVTPDDDATYVFSATEGDYDTYAFDDLPAGTWDVLGVQTSLIARAEGGGAKFLRPVIRSGVSEVQGASFALGASYGLNLQVFDDNPVTAAPWTQSEVDGVEIGPEVRDS